MPDWVVGPIGVLLFDKAVFDLLGHGTPTKPGLPLMRFVQHLVCSFPVSSHCLVKASPARVYCMCLLQSCRLEPDSETNRSDSETRVLKLGF